VRIAFNIAVGVWVLSEWGIRLRSHFHREGSRLDHGSMLVVVASIVAGVLGALALARTIPGAAIPDALWLLVAGLVLMGAGIAASRIAASPRVARACSPGCGDAPLTGERVFV
jgi:hypothetical protein